MKKIVRLTERDLTRLVKRVILEQEEDEEGWVAFLPLHRKFQDTDDKTELFGIEVKVYNKGLGEIIGMCDDGFKYKIMLNSGEETCSNPRDLEIKEGFDVEPTEKKSLKETFNDKLNNMIMFFGEQQTYNLLFKFLDDLMEKEMNKYKGYKY